MTPLMICSQRGCGDLVKSLLERSAKVNLKDNNHFGALHQAINSDNGENVNIVSMLLDNGANIDQKNPNYVRIVSFAG